MLTSTSPPNLRLHPEPPITKSSGHFSTSCAFDSLNRAFQLATGWSLGLTITRSRFAGSHDPASQSAARYTSTRKLYIEDLAEASFGKASVGRRYAENLVANLNLFLHLDQSADPLPIGQPIDMALPKTGVASPKTGVAVPELVNFEIGCLDKTGCLTHNFHTKFNGDVVILRHLWSSTQDARAARLQTAFDCLADQTQSARELLGRLQTVLSKYELEDAELPIEILIVKDHQFECEFASNFGALASNHYLLDFGLGRIKQTFQSCRSMAAIGSSVERTWIGTGQAHVTVNRSHLTSWGDIFSGSLDGAARMPAGQIVQKIISSIHEPDRPAICPILVKRK